MAFKKILSYITTVVLSLLLSLYLLEPDPATSKRQPTQHSDVCGESLSFGGFNVPEPPFCHVRCERPAGASCRRGCQP